MAKTEEET